MDFRVFHYYMTFLKQQLSAHMVTREEAVGQLPAAPKEVRCACQASCLYEVYAVKPRRQHTDHPIKQQRQTAALGGVGFVNPTGPSPSRQRQL